MLQSMGGITLFLSNHPVALLSQRCRYVAAETQLAIQKKERYFVKVVVNADHLRHLTKAPILLYLQKKKKKKTPDIFCFYFDYIYLLKYPS